MLDALLRMIKPEELVYAIKHNPIIVQITLQKLDAYRSFGNALTNEQQVFISNNLDKLDTFFNSPDGKECISSLADGFVRHSKAK